MPLPLDLLEQSIQSPLSLTLKDGRIVEGLLVGFDQHMNLVLEDATERLGDRTRPLGTILLRGNNLVSIAQTKATTTSVPTSPA